MRYLNNYFKNRIQKKYAEFNHAVHTKYINVTVLATNNKY